MKNLSNILLEKLKINKNTTSDDYEFVDAKSLTDIENWIHNEWNGEESFLISKKFSSEEISYITDYMYELDSNNGESRRADYWADDDYREDAWLINVDLDG